jgi:Domain of unknown function (DUF3806)
MTLGIERAVTMETTYQPPADTDIDRLAKMWLFVSQRITEQFGVKDPQGKALIQWAQSLLDENAIENTEYAGKALGCVLGMTLVDQVEGLAWAVCNDEYGKDLCLRFKQTSLTIFPLDMVLRRREKNEPVDMPALFADLEKRVLELATTTAKVN